MSNYEDGNLFNTDIAITNDGQKMIFGGWQLYWHVPTRTWQLGHVGHEFNWGKCNNNPINSGCIYNE